MPLFAADQFTFSCKQNGGKVRWFLFWDIHPKAIISFSKSVATEVDKSRSLMHFCRIRSLISRLHVSFVGWQTGVWEIWRQWTKAVPSPCTFYHSSLTPNYSHMFLLWAFCHFPRHGKHIVRGTVSKSTVLSVSYLSHCVPHSGKFPFPCVFLSQ